MNNLFIKPVFGDPVRNAVIATITTNPFYGYYGYPRDNGQTRHRGFDYFTKEPTAIGKGDDVLAVGVGDIVRVRFGHPYGKCYHKENIKNNNFTANVCTNCPVRSNCYGIHVWLKLDNTNNYYALYAHLSELSETIINQLPIESKSNTIDISPIKVKIGDVIGKSGRTGIASEKDEDKNNNIHNEHKWPPHLHFECRQGNGVTIPEKDTQIIPNHILNTNFTMMRVIDNLSFGVNVWPALQEVTQNEWIAFFNQKQREESDNQTSQTSPICFKIVGDDSFNNSSLAFIRL